MVMIKNETADIWKYKTGTLGLWNLSCEHSSAFLTELTWHVLCEGYLTSLLLVHQLTLDLDGLAISMNV